MKEPESSWVKSDGVVCDLWNALRPGWKCASGGVGATFHWHIPPETVPAPPLDGRARVRMHNWNNFRSAWEVCNCRVGRRTSAEHAYFIPESEVQRRIDEAVEKYRAMLLDCVLSLEAHGIVMPKAPCPSCANSAKNARALLAAPATGFPLDDFCTPNAIVAGCSVHDTAPAPEICGDSGACEKPKGHDGNHEGWIANLAAPARPKVDVFTRPECIWRYCNDPLSCQEACQNPRPPRDSGEGEKP